MSWEDILKEDYDKRKVGYHFNLSQDMKEEIRGEQPNQSSEMNKHRLFMRGKDLKKKIERRNFISILVLTPICIIILTLGLIIILILIFILSCH